MSEEYFQIPASAVVEKVDRIDTNVTRLLERQERDSETLEDHETRLRTLEKLLYRAALPAGGLGLAGVLAEMVSRWLS